MYEYRKGDFPGNSLIDMLSLIVAFLVIACDQISKLIVVEKLIPIGSYNLIDGVLRFTYVENRGAAFGMLSDSRAVFMALSIIIIVMMGLAIWKYHGISKPVDLCMGLILGGGIGNMIDRIRLGYVVDFIDFYVFDFWKYVFNIADSAVVVGCLFFVALLFFDKKLNSLFDKKDRGETNE